MERTGNTQGIRLSIIPPISASDAACSIADRDAGALGGGPCRTATLLSSNACRAAAPPVSSSRTSKPPASVGGSVSTALRSRRRVKPPGLSDSGCGAACRTSVSELGKKDAERIARVSRSLVSTSSVSWSGATARRAGQDARCGKARRAISNIAAFAGSGVGDAPGSATFRLSDRLASPGMHSRSHTSQVTSALRATGPAPSSWGAGVMRVSRVVSCS